LTTIERAATTTTCRWPSRSRAGPRFIAGGGGHLPGSAARTCVSRWTPRDSRNTRSSALEKQTSSFAARPHFSVRMTRRNVLFAERKRLSDYNRHSTNSTTVSALAALLCYARVLVLVLQERSCLHHCSRLPLHRLRRIIHDSLGPPDSTPGMAP